MTRAVRGVFGGVAIVGLVALVAACEEQSPTSSDPDGVPVEVQTVELEIPWSEFGQRIESFGGFGSASRIGEVVVAKDLGGILDSRALIRFDTFPAGVAVRNAEGLLVTDTVITIRSGRLIALADTSAADSLTTWTFAAGVLDQPWDVVSADWESAIDSVGQRVAWDEPGAGPVRSLGQVTADVGASGDSIVFDLDDVTLAEWADSVGSERTARIDLVSSDERVDIRSLTLRLEIGSSVAPDTTVFRDVSAVARTFIYTPEPEAPEGVVRVGGSPSWRTVLGLDVPEVLNGPAALCELAGCPVELTSESLSRASLVLRSRATLPAAFQPVDSVLLDVRPVLAPGALPRSPLGSSLVGEAALGADAFGSAAGQPFEIPITTFVRRILDAEEGGTPPPTNLALLSLVEPLDISFAEFDGPGDPGAPVLRLLVTVTDAVRYR
ncbi:MAG TPA: hypothetical protein VJ925_12985 [Longimicrobiales bacterium]|nr:hypothetical protein [Longimicrobiales bacterium]